MIKSLFMHSTVRAFTLLILAIILIFALGSYNQNDPSFNLSTTNEPTNLLGYMGSYIADLLYQASGVAAFIIPIAFISWSYIIFKHGSLKWKLAKSIFLLLSLVFTSILFDNISVTSFPAGGGGFISVIVLKLAKGFSVWLSSLAFLAVVPCLIMALGISFSVYVNFIYSIKIFVHKLFFKTKIPEISLPKQVIAPEAAQRRFFKFNLSALKDGITSYFKKNSFKSSKGETRFFREEPIIAGNKSNFEQVKQNVNLEPSSHQNNPKLIETRVQNSITQSSVTSFSNNVIKAPLTQQEEDVLPSVDLLDEAEKSSVQFESPAELEQKAGELLKVLGDFGVKGKVIDIRQGPVVTMYEFEPAAGTKSSRVIGLADDIARSLSALSTRIAVIPGRNALGIELPNKQRMFFRLKELVQTTEFQDSNVLLPLILGKDLGGKPLIADLAKMPHLLVAGTTGSGKSVAINAMIMSLLYRYTPSECRMIMIDPKMLELSAYDNIPHLMTPVVTEPGKAVVALKWAVKEMENRYRLMSHLGVRNIANFNAKIIEAVKEGRLLERKAQTGFDPETGKPIFESVPIEMVKMPFIVVIVDEMADLMLVAGKDIETSIQRLAQMARAAGIHIIMATQRPSVDVITGVIKANFPSRISFKVTSKIDSRTILGEQGSEQLLGMGDMLYMGNSSRILRVHGPFVDDKEVERITDFLRSTGTPEYISAVTQSDEDPSENQFDSQENDDDIYQQAVNIVRNERKSSISYIQRALRIGYNRAANIVEEMEKNGILSEPNHSGKREILIPEN